MSLSKHTCADTTAATSRPIISCARCDHGAAARWANEASCNSAMRASAETRTESLDDDDDEDDLEDDEGEEDEDEDERPGAVNSSASGAAEDCAYATAVARRSRPPGEPKCATSRTVAAAG